MIEKGNEIIVSDAFIESIIWGEGYQAFIYKIKYLNQNCDLDALRFCDAPQIFKTSHFMSSSGVVAVINAIKSKKTTFNCPPSPVFQTKYNQSTESTECGGCN